MTPIFVVAIVSFVLVAIIIFDIWLYSDELPGNSISQIIVKHGRKHPLIPWSIGFVMGALTLHWFDSLPQ